MNCRDWEERIALYVEGDEPPAAAAETKRHLEKCAPCREFAASVQQDLALLRTAHAEPLAPANYAVVRARVLEQIERKRRPWRLAGMGAIAAAALIAVLLWPKPHRQTAPRMAVANPPARQLPPAPPSVAEPRQVVRLRRAKHRRGVSASEPLLVKLVTDDPNIVIYWIVN